MFVFRFQTERIADTTKLSLARRNCHLRYEHLALAKPTMRIFHPLPINSQFPEIDPLIDDTEFQYFFNQAGNGVPIRIVVLACFLGVMGEDFQGESPASRVLNDYFIHRREPRARAETDEELNLKPIRDWGVVIDHFPAARLKLLVDYLVRDGEVYRGGVVRKHSDPTKTKGLLMIEHRTLTDAERRIVAAMGQGELTAGELPTVNDIVDGSVAEKVDLTIPDLIEGIGQCTNIIFDRETGKPKGGCISRPEFHQHATPRFYRVDDQQVQCAYCDTVMESYRIFE
jgi:aspartate carbamoyltransferase regulatory subunit